MAFRLVNRDRLLAPRKCVVCEQKPSGRVVDTGHNNMRNTMNEVLRGRKYICEACGEKIGKALGMLHQAQVSTLKERIIDLENTLEAQDRVAEIAANVEAIRGYFQEEAENAVADVPES